MTDGYLLDSNICIYLLKNLSPVLAEQVRKQDEGSVYVSTISLAEVGLGARGDAEQSAALEAFLRDVVVVPFDAEAASRFAAIPFRRGGFDRLIAAHALALDLTLVTNNERDFADVPGLVVENWTL